MKFNNYFMLHGLNIFYQKIAYFDNKSYLGSKLFVQNKVRGKYLREYNNDNEDYVIVICKVYKRDLSRFYYCMEKLKDNMLIAGYNGYEDFCIRLENILLKAERNMNNGKQRV